MPVRPLLRLLALALPVAAAASAVVAQQTNSGVSIGPSQSVQQPAPAAAPVEHLLGDWGGVRTSLGDLGIDVLVDFTSEFAGNVSGGTKRGATFANQVGFEADVDWDKLAGLHGFSTHVVIVNRTGSSDSALFGDNVNTVQEIYGGGGDVVAHLVYAYGEESLADGRINIAAGRLPVLNDFAASPLYCNFMNVSICGNPGTLSAGDIGLSVYPDATWGGRVRVRPTPTTYVQAGIYEVSQGLFAPPYFRSGWNFDTARDSGVELPVEIGYLPLLGPDRLPGHYKLGFGYDSSGYPDQYRDALGGSALAGGQPFARHDGRFRAWALADQMLLRNGPGDDSGLIVLGAYVHGDPNTSAYQDQVSVGLLDRGFWPARKHDGIGALMTYERISSRLRREQELQAALGLPLAHSATAAQSSEIVLELNYDVAVARGVTFQPEAQYVIRPNAQRSIGNATVFGFKTHVTF